MPGAWRFLMSADDVFVHPAKWQPISRATAIAIYWRIPVVVAPEGQSGGASWLDELSPYLSGFSPAPLDQLRYFRYLDPVPQLPGLPVLGPAPQQSNADQPPVEEQKFWINVVVVDEFGDFVPGLGVTVIAPGGAKTGGTTDGKGRVVVNNLKSGKAKVSLGKHVFFEDKSGAGSAVKPAEVAHQMGEAETLGGVARKYGTTDGRSIYYYPANSALKGKRAALGLVEPKDSFKVPKSYEFEFPTKPDGENHEYKLEVPAMLDITRCDPHFAPSKETLDIQYDLALLKKQKVILEISSPHLDGGKPLFKKELTAAEKSDGSHTFKWDGKATDGKVKDKHISPLYSKYKVKLYVEGKAKHTDEREFAVLYHSIALRLGPWTPDEKVPTADDKKIAAYHLNRLGYWAGPVGHDFDSYLKKAVILYKSNHPKFHQVGFASYNDTITADLKTALAAGDAKRDFFTGNALKTKKGLSKILVENLCYEVGEFGNGRSSYEEQRRSRPMLPLEVDVLLVSKKVGRKGKKKGVVAPGGVGPARISFSWVDPPENLKLLWSATKTSPSKTRKYVKKALALKGGTGDNCHKDFKGIRDHNAAANYKTPFHLGTDYEPHEVKDDSGQKKVYVHAFTDATKHGGKRVGKAGLMFRPSYVGGDSYKLKVELEFKKDLADLPNKADLEKLHGLKAGETMSLQTGTLQVWRFGKIAMVVRWPGRTSDRELGKIRTEYLKAYNDIKVSPVIKKISEVMTNAQFKALCGTHTTLPAAGATLSDAYMFGRPNTPQGNQNAATYSTLIDTDVNNNFWSRNNFAFADALVKQLSTNIRGTHSTVIPAGGPHYPRGFVLVEIVANDPVDIKKDPLNGQNAIVYKKYTAPISSLGQAEAFDLLNQTDPDQTYYVVAHEMGHSCYLEHSRFAGGENVAQHDSNDANCAMAYPWDLRNTAAVPPPPATAPHKFHHVSKYTPHFCGKCNLKLRGWDIDKATGASPDLPAGS